LFFSTFIIKNNFVLQKKPKIILGVDPGTLMMGYGLIEIGLSGVRLIEMNVLKIPPRKDAYERLHLIHTKVQQIIAEFRPDDFAIEAPFFGKNVQSMLKLGRAQGVAIAAALQAGIPVTEYSPRKIKQSITGNGNAGKEQVWKMLQQILSVQAKLRQFDASDALAVALCHYFQANTIKMGQERLSGWKEFIAKNPGRLRT
jgi:crossover junction endodeoxyribonuclease RuvC